MAGAEAARAAGASSKASSPSHRRPGSSAGSADARTCVCGGGASALDFASVVTASAASCGPIAARPGLHEHRGHPTGCKK